MSKLLIIDDERGIRNTLREILADEGHEVDVAENGKQGLEMAQAKAYDLIFSDIKMPEMDGMEVLKALKNGENDENGDATLNGETPVVMITGHGDVETAVQALKTGAFDFLLKPQISQTRDQTAAQESGGQRSADDRRECRYHPCTRDNR